MFLAYGYIYTAPCGTESEITNTKLKISLSAGNGGNEWGDGGEEVMGGQRQKSSTHHLLYSVSGRNGQRLPI